MIQRLTENWLVDWSLVTGKGSAMPPSGELIRLQAMAVDRYDFSAQRYSITILVSDIAPSP